MLSLKKPFCWTLSNDFRRHAAWFLQPDVSVNPYAPQIPRLFSYGIAVSPNLAISAGDGATECTSHGIGPASGGRTSRGLSQTGTVSTGRLSDLPNGPALCIQIDAEDAARRH
jgi:hypothetical protein